MQHNILKHKNKITSISGLLIALGLIAHFIFANTTISNSAFIIASILGVTPISLQAYQAMKVKVVSIDVLVTIAVIGALFIQNYEESAIVTFLFLFGSYLEQRTLNQTRSAIKELTEMAPETAFKQLTGGQFAEVDIDEVEEGDILLVKTGAKIPVDGRVTTGKGYVNEANITGESLPLKKEKDDEVFAGTIMDNGTIQIVADRVGEDSTFGKIIELVEEAQDSKSEAERFIDQFSRWYTPAVLTIGLLVWVLTKDTELAITVLVLGCPGALVIGVPVSNVAGIGNGAKNGILFKGSEVISHFSNADTVLFDKTGTLTEGKPEVSDIIYYGNNQEEDLSLLLSVESESDHPLAVAIVNKLAQYKVRPIENTQVVKGGGVIAHVDGHVVSVGNKTLMKQESIPLSDDVLKKLNKLERTGNSIVLAAVDHKLIMLMGIRDKVRPGVKQDLQKLK
ncbi:MAG: heavy metal translocating P-type ATPase, partial [Streptococcus salivarius]|nr:heavy metal translocating P-type ATPase [Streptococcus salivarius]